MPIFYKIVQLINLYVHVLYKCLVYKPICPCFIKMLSLKPTSPESPCFIEMLSLKPISPYFIKMFKTLSLGVDTLSELGF